MGREHQLPKPKLSERELFEAWWDGELTAADFAAGKSYPGDRAKAQAYMAWLASSRIDADDIAKEVL